MKRGILCLAFALVAIGCVARPEPSVRDSALTTPLPSQPSSPEVIPSTSAETGSPFSSASPAGVDAVVPACDPAMIRAGGAHLQGATGSMAGGFLIRNDGPAPCVVQGRPVISIVGGRGHPLAIDLARFDSVEKPVVLTPQRDFPELGAEEPVGLGRLFLVWGNWCQGDPPGPLGLRVTLPAADGVLRVPLESGVPRCDSPDAPSGLSIGAIEATTVPEPS